MAVTFAVHLLSEILVVADKDAFFFQRKRDHGAIIRTRLLIMDGDYIVTEIA